MPKSSTESAQPLTIVIVSVDVDALVGTAKTVNGRFGAEEK